MAPETERIEVKPFVPQCPFHIRKPGEYKEPEDLKLVTRVTDQVKVDKETMVVSPVTEKFDLDAEIQTYKGQCGLEYFKQLVLQGRANKEDSWDDGQHAVDTGLIPTTIHEAKAKSNAISDALAKVAKDAGIKDGKKMTSEEFLEAVGEYLDSLHAEPGNVSSDPAPKE